MTTPRELARDCDLAMAARWRGEDAAAEAFTAWLEGHWWAGCPAEPPEPPAAMSVLGGAGAGVRWYARGGAMFGYVRGRRGCYCVPADASPPAIPTSGESEAGLPVVAMTS
jgi:hypothetical protein